MAEFVGDSTDNSISGTNTADSISGLAGSDVLRGRAGSDLVSGGAGDDTASGGAGQDRINGGSGDDLLYGFGASDKYANSGTIDAKLIASGLERPLFAASAPGDPDRLFVVEQHEARIQILDLATGEMNDAPFLDIANEEISNGGEQGLLGLAFHPNYETNGQFFIYLTNTEGDIEVRRYTRSAGDPDLADPASSDVILTIDKSDSVHNGGWMAFGPDRMLYISVGDGNSGGDPANNAQNLNSLQGKILRIDVDGDDFTGNDSRDYAIPADNPFAGSIPGANEIWAYGLRNPWRCSFDRLTGDFYVGDVGEGSREEVNFQDASSSGGENYGWKVKEGSEVFDDDDPGNPSPDDPSLFDPVFEYPMGRRPTEASR